MTKIGARVGTLGLASGAVATGGVASSTATSAPVATSAVSTPTVTSNLDSVFALGMSSKAIALISFTTLIVTNMATDSATPLSTAAPIGSTSVSTALAALSIYVPYSNNGTVIYISTT